jgi:hypothetical protein
MYSAFQSNAFQRNAFQILGSGGVAPVVVDQPQTIGGKPDGYYKKFDNVDAAFNPYEAAYEDQQKAKEQRNLKDIKVVEIPKAKEIQPEFGLKLKQALEDARLREQEKIRLAALRAATESSEEDEAIATLLLLT